MPLSEILKDIERVNWSKGAAALEKLTSSLYDYVRDAWKKYLTTWSIEEQDYIPEFIEHAQMEYQFEYCGIRDKAPKPAWKCRCPDSRCTSIISRILEKRQNPRSKTLNWRIKMSPNVSKYENYQDFYWEFAKMYMFFGKESTVETFTCPEDTDITMVLKMMQNCNLFELDDNNLYGNVLLARNSLMHSSTYKLSTTELLNYVDTMKSLLAAISDKTDLSQHKSTFNATHDELDKLVKTIRLDVSQEELDIIISALEWQKKAIQSDMRFNGINGLQASALNDFLEANNRQIVQYTVIVKEYRPILNIVNPDERRKALEEFEEKAKREEYERKQNEERKRQEYKEEGERKQKEETERRVNAEVERRVKQELERIQARRAKEEFEEKTKREEYERKQNEERKRQEYKEEGERKQNEETERRVEVERRVKQELERIQARGAEGSAHTTGAAIGGTIGMVGGPVGAVVGGTIGSIVGGLFGGRN